jgi:hypothetical protein
MIVWVFVTMTNLLGDLWLVALSLVSCAIIHEKFKVIPCRVKIQGLALIGCVWPWVLVEGIVLWARIFPRVKTYDLWLGDDLTCALFPSWRCRYWRSWTSRAVLVEFVLPLQEIDQCSRTFLFSNSFFWLCPSLMSLEHCVIATVVCNWYLHDINLCSLSKKSTFSSCYPCYSC